MEQVIRPTGLVDPEVIVKPVEGQIDDLMEEIRQRAGRKERVLVTTLTKKMAEDLTTFLENNGIRIRYMHHDIDTMERMEIIRDLRLGEFDVLVGINLLREGLDIPEVSLVAILDADKEGFLRSRNQPGADHRPGGPQCAGTGYHVRRSGDTLHGTGHCARPTGAALFKWQYNEAHGIVPKTIIKDVREVIEITSKHSGKSDKPLKRLSKAERLKLIEEMTREMKNAAKLLEFEHAAYLRDRIQELQNMK